MKCNFEIEYLRPEIKIDRRLSTFSTEYKRKTNSIERILDLISIERKKKTAVLVKYNGAVIKIYVPINTDWIWMQNRFLPTKGQYFLN